MENEITLHYTVLSYWLVKELGHRGFRCIGTGENKNKAGFKVFYFEDTDELRNAINEIKKEYHNAKIQKWKQEKIQQSRKFYHRQKNR